jgi:redox-sensitive bicupin YhaK (pirin superfamily)
MAMVHATVAPGAQLELPWDASYNALVYVLGGRGTVGIDGSRIRTGNLAVLGAGDFVSVAADGSQDSRTPALDVLVIGGQPINEPIAWAGPFVMNTRSEVVEAFEDFQKGKLGTIPAVHGAPTDLQEG